METTENKVTRSLPLCVTRVCLSPSFLNMLTTVSIGVLSMIVIGARSKIFHNFSGGPLDAAVNPENISTMSKQVHLRLNLLMFNLFRCTYESTHK